MNSTPDTSSPGNAFYPETPPMRRPGLTYLYRLECDIDKDEIDLGAPHGAGVIRSIANIIGGTFKGPGGLSGTSITLDARYTAKTDDGHYLYIQAHGLYRPGPGTAYARQVAEDPRSRPPSTVSQDDVEFFSHLRIEAGPGRYNWLNGLVCVGVMTCVEDRIVIDAYYLTNFGGVRPDDVVMKSGGWSS